MGGPSLRWHVIRRALRMIGRAVGVPDALITDALNRTEAMTPDQLRVAQLESIRQLYIDHFGEEMNVSMSLAGYLERQREWSRRTFGEGPRTVGVTEHIKKEIEEIRADPHDLSEWIDVIILAMDGYWRAGGTPERVMADLQAKQFKNFRRQWPTEVPPQDQPSFHVKE